MPELLLELGCEELPASFVRKAYIDLQELVEQRLSEAGIPYHRPHQPIGTPRRLIISLDIEPRQPDQTKEMRGPALKAAYDASGNPTPALQGFCRGQGVELTEVRSEGEYVWVTKTIVGRPTSELLQEVLPDAIRAMSFDKSMRWGAARMRFARPIRWIVAVFDGQAVPFEVEGVSSGTRSRGHRFEHPEEFEARSRESLLQMLRQRMVEPDPSLREEWIRSGAKSCASGEPIMTEALVEENVFLTEWPQALEGEFKPEYLELPRPVLVTAMAKHERFFPVADSTGKLLNRFVSIRNGGEEATVRRGNEWVLNARFNDAKFFYDEDSRRTMADFLEKTKGILFQDKLGTVRERADRLASLCEYLAEATGADANEVEFARTAGLYCKADLSTGLVSELPSLQGAIGAEYGRREGFAEEVVTAIEAHYDLAKVGNTDTGAGRTAMRLLIADALDKLAGYLAIGLAPSGSSDPFALRRATTHLIEAAWMWKGLGIRAADYSIHLAHAMRGYGEIAKDHTAVGLMLQDVFLSRYPVLLPEVRHDILDAATEHDALNPRAVRLKAGVLEELASDSSFVFTATRPINIVSAARAKGLPVPPFVELACLQTEALQSSEGETLAQALRGVEQAVYEAWNAEDSSALAAALRPLQKPIDAFFDSTMVMVDDEDVRNARLHLLQICCQALFKAGDFSKLVVA
jgi:glycyl-tRNA synthetase beta chain